ncbi:hypothetical protein Tco_0304316 [Tanacetum coccineum]
MILSLSLSRLIVEVNESVSESVVEKPTVETNEPKTARKENGAPIIEIGCLKSEGMKITTVNNAGPMKNVINNAYSTARRPFNKITAANNSNFNKGVNTVNNKNVNAARPNAVVNNARPKAVGNPHQDLEQIKMIAIGCSRHMTRNRSYLTEYKEIDGGFVTFRGNSKEGKITGKGKIRIGKLDFEDVYFVKELKFNLFSVSQICDKKNSGEYEMWKLRIEQYFSSTRLAQWDVVIDNGNSFKPAAQTTTNADGSSTTLVPGPITADEKTQKKNDVKARSDVLNATSK